MIVRLMDLNDIEYVITKEKEYFGQSLFDDDSSLLERSKCFIFESDGNKIGYLSSYVFAPEAEILNFFIDKEYRRHGYAYQAFLEIEKIFSCEEVNTIILDVNCNNSKAIGLYHKLGFKEISRRKAYYNDKSDSIMMSKGVLL